MVAVSPSMHHNEAKETDLDTFFTFPRSILQQSKHKFSNSCKHLINIDLILINNTVMTLNSHHHHFCQAKQWMKQNILLTDHHCWSSLHTVHHATTQALVRLPMYREHLLLLSNTVSTVSKKYSGQANHVSKTLLLKTFYCQQL